MSEHVFKVKCPQCAVVVKFLPQTAESQLTCPKCSQKMRVKTPLAVITTAAEPTATRPAAPRPTATRPAAPRPATRAIRRVATPTAGASRPTSAASPPTIGPSWADFPTDLAAVPTMPTRPTAATRGSNADKTSKGGWASRFSKGSAPAVPFAPVQTPAAAYRSSAPARPRGTGGRVIKKLLIGAAVLISGVIGLLVMVAVLGYIAGGMGRPQSKSTMTLMGWSVDAPGRVVTGPQGPQADSKDILHRVTNSEFSMAATRVAQPGQSFTIEQILDNMRAGAPLSDVQPVERSGLNGYHFSMPIPGRGIRGTVEIFKIDEWHILLLVYITGQEKERANIGKARHNEQKTRELDDPDAFFASLRRG